MALKYLHISTEIRRNEDDQLRMYKHTYNVGSRRARIARRLRAGWGVIPPCLKNEWGADWLYKQVDNRLRTQVQQKA